MTTEEVILPTLAIEHPNIIGPGYTWHCTFDVTGGDQAAGFWHMIVGSRSVVPSSIPGRVLDTWRVFYSDTQNTTTGAEKIISGTETLERAFRYAADPESAPVYLVERYFNEPRKRSARVFSGSITYADGIPGWELYKGSREAVISIEREAVWQGELLFSSFGNLGDFSESALTQSARILDKTRHISGNRPGVVEALLIRPGTSTTTLRQVWVGFKDASRVGLDIGFDPHINIARGVGGSSTGVGATYSVIVTDDKWWRGRALRIQFKRGNTDQSEFMIRQQVPYAEWNSVATAANYPKFAGRYRLVGRVTYANPSEATTYKLQAALAFGSFAQGRKGYTWLDEVWKRMPGEGGPGSITELVDFGEVNLPFPQSTRSEWDRTAGAMNPLLVLGAGVISGDTVGAMVTIDRMVLMPAAHHIRLNWPGGVSGDYHFRVFGSPDGTAVAYVSDKTGTGLSSSSKEKLPDNWRTPWEEFDYDEAAGYGQSGGGTDAGGYWSQIDDVTVSEGGLYTPFSQHSAIVVTADGPCHAVLYNRVRVAT